MKEDVKKDEPTVNAGDTPEYCGGKVKPQDVKGKIGEWNCVGGEWVWSDFIGK